MQLRDVATNHSPQLAETSLTWRGRLVFLLFALFALAGIWRQSWFFLVLGLLGAVTTLLLLLQFRVDLAHGFEETGHEGDFSPIPGNTARAGGESEIQFVLKGVDSALKVRRANVHHSGYIRSYLTHHRELSSRDSSHAPLPLIPGRSFSLRISLETPVAGRFMLHGVALVLEDAWSLFRTSRYVHCPMPLRVLPGVPLSRLQRQGRKLRRVTLEKRGAPQRRVGSGSDLRDIRDYQPGDARRLIAWKHSLRHRKLLCREFESESPLTSYILLDIGQSMREGDLGDRKLDYACDVASAFARAAIEQRDSVGLVSFDGKVYRHQKAASGQQQLHVILRHLGSLHQIVERDFAHITMGSLCHLVGRFLWREGILASPGGRSQASPRQTVEFVWDYIQQHPTLQLPKAWTSDQDLIDAVLRLFCREVGVELPYRYSQWVTFKSAGLRDSIDAAVNNMHGGQMLLILSDLGDMIHWDGVLKALRRARQKRHHVVFLCPFSPWFTKPPEDEDSEYAILREMLTLEQWTWRKRIQQLVSPLGIPVMSVDAETAPLALLQRLQRLRLGGRM